MRSALEALHEFKMGNCVMVNEEMLRLVSQYGDSLNQYSAVLRKCVQLAPTHANATRNIQALSCLEQISDSIKQLYVQEIHRPGFGN
jgi:hypothetical protein